MMGEAAEAEDRKQKERRREAREREEGEKEAEYTRKLDDLLFKKDYAGASAERATVSEATSPGARAP